MYYDNLPIFKSALDLVVYVETIVKGFDKYHKYTLGEDLRQQSKEILFLIQRANMSEKRSPELVHLRNKCEEVKMLIHVTHELKVFKGFNQFEHCAKLSHDVCRQAQAWLSLQIHFYFCRRSCYMILSIVSVRLNIVRFSRPLWHSALRTLWVTFFACRAKEENLTSNNYCSSTTNANNTSNAWIVNFNNGNTNNNNKSNSNNVRCVR